MTFSAMYDHSPLYALCLQITSSDIRPRIAWTVRLVFANGQLIFRVGLCPYVWVNILTLLPRSVGRVGTVAWRVMATGEAGDSSSD